MTGLILALALAAPPIERSYPARVLAVHDGDTVRADVDLGFGVVLRDQPVRLRGIDAPELPTKAGLDARDRLEDFLAGHRVVLVVQAGRERDKYGRLLGRLLLDPCAPGSVCDAGSEMLRTGNAQAYDGGAR